MVGKGANDLAGGTQTVNLNAKSSPHSTITDFPMPDSTAEIPFEIDCQQVKQLLDGDEPFLLLDVRTPDEHAVVNLSDAVLLPMQEIVERASELAPHQDSRVVVFCHHGGRSERVAHWLREQGFAKAQNMVGGIDNWAVQIDTSLPRY